MDRHLRGLCVPLLLAVVSATAGMGMMRDERLVQYVANETGSTRIVSLLYHKFVTPAEFETLRGDDRLYAISTERFEAHLRWLRDEGYRALSTAECLSLLAGKGRGVGRNVYLTFDDGYVSALTRAEPLLKKYGMRAAVFVTASEDAEVFKTNQPRQRRMTAEELRRLDPAVFDVQAHGVTHRPMTQLSDADLRQELTRSRQVLEEIMGRPVHAMAVPGNHYDARVLRAARAVGYDAVFTSDRGAISAGDDPIGLPRVNVAGYFTAKGLASLMHQAAAAKRR